MNTDYKETINAKHGFTTEEIVEFGERLAQKLQDKAMLTEEFSAIKKQWGSKIEAVENEVTSLAQKISCKFDYRPTECSVVFDPPNRRKKYYRVADGTLAHEDEMTASDFQMNLPTETVSTPPEPGKIVSVGEALEAAQDQDVPAEPPVEEEPAKKKGVKSRKSKADPKNQSASELIREARDEWDKADPFPTAGGIVNPTPDLPLKDDDNSENVFE